MNKKQVVSTEEVGRKLRLDYMYSSKDDYQKILDNTSGLLKKFRKQAIDLDGFFDEVITVIRRRLWVREVTVALFNPDKDAYMYRYMGGLRHDTWEAHKSLSYTKDELINPKVYKSREISKDIILFLAEDNPYGEGEAKTYNRPAMLESMRRSVEDSIEGDYFDIWIRGKNDDILGWIEISGTIDYKFPTIESLRWMEILASITGLAVELSKIKNEKGRRF